MSKTNIEKEVKIGKSTYEVEIKKDKSTNGKDVEQQLADAIKYFFKRKHKVDHVVPNVAE